MVRAAVADDGPRVRAGSTMFSGTLNRRLLYVAVPVASGGVVHGAVRITYPTAELDRRITRNWLLLAAVAAVVLAAATLASFLIARSVARPLRVLRATTRAFADGQLGSRADVTTGPPEVRGVAHSFNVMAARLEQLLESQRAFVADASHQLRTPLTALRLRLENLESEVAGDTAAELAAAIDETNRLGRLVEGLLLLARTDGTPADPVPVDVAEILRARQESWRPVAEDRGISLEVEVGSSLAALTLPGAVDQVLDNLIANAVRVAPEDSAIRVTAEPDGDTVEVHVIDAGPGMSAEQRSHAFDRFWRSRTADHDGFGLGLAIVDRLVAASGGTVELREADSGGLDAVVRLPAARGGDRGGAAVRPPTSAQPT